MKKEFIQIQFRKELINGMLFLPDSKKPAPLVLHLNGMPGFEPEKEETRFAIFFTLKNYAYFAFDYVGVRQSTGLFEYIYSQENINLVLSKLVHHPRINPSRIGLLGESFGGAMALCHTSRDDRIRCLAIRSPVYDTEEIPKMKMFDGLVQLWRASKQMRFPRINLRNSFLFQSRHYNPMKQALHLKCPVRIITGDRDDIVPVEKIEKLYAKIPDKIDKEMRIVPGADHKFSKTKDFEIMKDYFSRFFEAYL